MENNGKHTVSGRFQFFETRAACRFQRHSAPPPPQLPPRRLSGRPVSKRHGDHQAETRPRLLFFDIFTSFKR